MRRVSLYLAHWAKYTKLAACLVVAISLATMFNVSDAKATPSYYLYLDSNASVNAGPQQHLTYDGSLLSSGGDTENSLTATATGVSSGSGDSTEVTGYAYSEADLAQGAVRAHAYGTNSAHNAASATAIAQLFDTLTFNLGTASSVSIGISLHLDGSSLGIGGNNNIQISIAGGAKRFNHEVTDANDTHQSITNFDTGWDSATVSNSTNHGVDFYGTFTVFSGQPTMSIMERLEAAATPGTDLRFQNTGFLNLMLPDGVTFTSGSGLFLSDPLSASVPEPMTLTIFGFGLAGLGYVRRRKRAA